MAARQQLSRGPSYVVWLSPIRLPSASDSMATSRPPRHRAEGIAALKQEDGPELQVHGSGNLIQTLMRHNLVDVRCRPLTRSGRGW